MAELKKCDIPKPSDKEFYNRLDDIRTIFNNLPDELKDTIREKRKPSEEETKKYQDEIKRYKLAIQARQNGINLTDKELKKPLNELEFLIQNRISWQNLVNPTMRINFLN